MYGKSFFFSCVKFKNPFIIDFMIKQNLEQMNYTFLLNTLKMTHDDRISGICFFFKFKFRARLFWTQVYGSLVTLRVPTHIFISDYIEL